MRELYNQLPSFVNLFEYAVYIIVVVTIGKWLYDTIVGIIKEE